MRIGTSERISHGGGEFRRATGPSKSASCLFGRMLRTPDSGDSDLFATRTRSAETTPAARGTDGDMAVVGGSEGTARQMLDVMGVLHALGSLTRDTHGRRAYGEAAHEKTKRRGAGTGGLLAALFETVPTGVAGVVAAVSDTVGAVGGTAPDGIRTHSGMARGTADDITGLPADTAIPEAIAHGIPEML